jgi:hypothetical protein
VDMSALRDLYQAGGPYASVYFEDTHESADADKEMELRWQDAREKLASHGTDEPTLGAMDAVLQEKYVPIGKSGRSIIAANGKVLLDAALPEPPQETVARYGRLPHLMPLLQHRSAGAAHVVVLVDSSGGEVYAFGVDGREVEEETVQGEAGPVHKPRGTALKHRKAQERVENTVAKNAQDVLAEAERLISETGAQLLVIAGEVQARTALREQLSQRAQGIAVETDTGGRAEGSDNDALQDAVDALVAEHVQATESEYVERFNAESGRDGGLATQGLDAVVNALKMSNVEFLLISDPAVAGRAAGVGADPSDVSTGDDLPAEATKENADEAVLGAAALTGAKAVFVPEVKLEDGIGAVLRHN